MTPLEGVTVWMHPLLRHEGGAGTGGIGVC